MNRDVIIGEYRRASFTYLAKPKNALLAVAGLFALALVAVTSVIVSEPTQSSALTTVPTKMNFQGRLTDSAGNIKPNGTYNLRLKLYTVDSGGSAVWSEDRLVSATQGVTLTNGLFAIQLGDVTSLPASLFASGPLYLEIELPTPATATSASPTWSEGPMTPRNQMATSAYAYNAETLDGYDSSEFLIATANNTFTGMNTFSNTSATAFSVQTAGAVEVLGVNTSTAVVSVSNLTTTGTMTMTGGTFANRPVAPAEGTSYFDTTQKRFLTYSNGKWQADRTDAILVAASNSSQADKDAADYVADGNTSTVADGDQVQINAALTAGSGKNVVLLAGTFVADETILIPNNTTFTGVGQGTVIELADLDATENLIENSDTANGTGITIQNLKMDGRKDLNTANSQNGIYVDSFFDSRIINISVSNFRTSGVHTTSALNNVFDNVHLNSNTYGFYMDTISRRNKIVNSSANSNTHGFYVKGGSDNIIANSIAYLNTGAGFSIGNATSSNNNLITGCYANANGTGFAATVFGENTTITSSSADGNNIGFDVDSFHGTISGNNIYSSATYAIRVDAGDNLISNNTIDNSGGSTTNNGIFITNSTTADDNSITSNTISDNLPTITNYAINISGSNPRNNYLADNILGGGTINDLGTGTIYANQQDGSGNIINRGQGGFSVNKSTATASLDIQGGLRNTALSTPAAATLTTSGTAGSTTRGYRISALDGLGETLASSETTIATTNATLTASNRVNVSWLQVDGAVQYKIYRTTSAGTPATTGLIATVAGNVLTLQDTGLTASGSIPTVNSTGGFSFSSSTGANLLGATGNGNVTVGTSDTTGTLFVLDDKTDAGDPTGVAGGMYYNSSAGKFRCYENGAWKDCDTAGDSSNFAKLDQANTYTGTNTFNGTTTTVGGTADVAKFNVASGLFNVDSVNSLVSVKSATDNAVAGAYLIDTAAGINDFPTGWSGTNWALNANSAPHTSGSTAVLASTWVPTVGTTYEVTYTYSSCSATNTLAVAMGGVTLQSGSDCVGTNTKVMVATNTTALRFTPASTYTGTVRDVRIRQITSVGAVLAVKNSSNITTLEIRSAGNEGNIFIGKNAGQNNTSSGTGNIAVGGSALQNNTIGYNNSAFGYSALRSNTSGYQNTAIGLAALTDNTTGDQNTAIGYNSLTNNTTGIRNTAIGDSSLYNNTAGDFNTATGNSSLSSNTTGDNNTANGYYSLGSNTTGYNNTATGDDSLRYNTFGAFNTANGADSLRENIDGSRNTASGFYSLTNNTLGDNNTAFGADSLFSNTTGGNNAAVGYMSLTANSTGSGNAAIGQQSLRGNMTGSYNSALGYSAGFQDNNSYFTTGSSLQRATAIGAFAQVQKNNTIVLGSVDNVTQVVIGATQLTGTNSFGVTPLHYQTGTATRTNGSATLTGTGTTWTAAMVGDTILFADGTTNTVSAFTSATSITMGTTYTGTTDASPVRYRFHYPGTQITNTGGLNVGGSLFAIDTSGTASFAGSTFSITGAANTAKFNVGSIFNVDTSASKVSIGAVDGTGTVLVLDTKNTAGDPTGESGAMYYNSNLAKFRCYEAGAWKDCISAGYSINILSDSSTATDSSTEYFAIAPIPTQTTSGANRININKAGTIKIADITGISATGGSSENISLYIRKNNTTDTLVSTVGTAATARAFTNNSLSIDVAPGDYIEVKAVYPSWSTNPSGFLYFGYIYIE